MLEKSKKSVFAIDDEEDIRELIHDSLELDDIYSDEAKDLQEAYGKLEKNCYKIVLIDRHLGSCLAEDFIDELRTRCPEGTKFVLMTGDAVDDIMHWKNKGFDYVIHKPFDIEDLNKFVLKLLESA